MSRKTLQSDKDSWRRDREESEESMAQENGLVVGSVCNDTLSVTRLCGVDDQ
jgi:hypothetical protein